MDATDTLGWEDHAACRQHDPEIWHTEATRPTALHICQSHCPVRTQCALWAQRVGGWAGQVVGGEWWVHHRGEHRPSRMDYDLSTQHCRTCRGDAADRLGATGRTIPRCGTARAAYRHRRLGEPIDAACRLALNNWESVQSARRRAALQEAV
jgi:hypothetical protein